MRADSTARYGRGSLVRLRHSAGTIGPLVQRRTTPHDAMRMRIVTPLVLVASRRLLVRRRRRHAPADDHSHECDDDPHAVRVRSGPARARSADGTAWFGMNLDWANDSVADVSDRLGATPSVWVQFVAFPLDDAGRGNLDAFIDQVAAVDGIGLITLEPTGRPRLRDGSGRRRARAPARRLLAGQRHAHASCDSRTR